MFYLFGLIFWVFLQIFQLFYGHQLCFGSLKDWECFGLTLVLHVKLPKSPANHSSGFLQLFVLNLPLVWGFVWLSLAHWVTGRHTQVCDFVEALVAAGSSIGIYVGLCSTCTSSAAHVLICGLFFLRVALYLHNIWNSQSVIVSLQTSFSYWVFILTEKTQGINHPNPSHSSPNEVQVVHI